MADTLDKTPLTAAPDPGALDEPMRQVSLRLGAESRLFAHIEGGAVGAEQFRLLHARLIQIPWRRPLRRLMVASAVSGEGKTHVAANLALSMARETGQKILLVDADLRKPAVHKLYGIENDYGLSNLLFEGGGGGAAIRRIRDTNLYVVTGGAPLTEPLAGFHAASLRAFLEEVSPRFDCVVVDSPPLLLVADATLLATLADGLLLVVRAHTTPRELVLKAKGLVDQEKILGTVLVGLDPMAPYGCRYEDLYRNYLDPARQPRTSSRLAKEESSRSG